MPPPLHSDQDSLLRQAKAITVSDLVKLNSDLKDAPIIGNSLLDNSELGETTAFDQMKLESFTKDEYMKIVQEWANLRRINTSFGTTSE